MAETSNAVNGAVANDQNSVTYDIDANINSLNERNDTIHVSSLEQRTLSPETFLYTEVIKSHLGERAVLVAQMLLSKGRLTIKELNERIPELNKSGIKAILVSLIQLRCVKYFNEEKFSGNITYYYFNEDGILLWLYSGLIIDEINRRFKSPLACQIIKNIISLGSVTLKDYIESDNSENIESEIKHSFVTLCENGFIIPLKEINYTPFNDLWNQLYETEYKMLPKNATLSDLKKKTEAKGKAKIEYLKRFQNLKDLTNIIVIDPQTLLRTVKSDIPLTVNLDRFLKTRRTKQLVQFAKSRVGSIPADIYKIALQFTEQKSLDLINPLTRTGLLQDIDEAKSIKDDEVTYESTTPGVFFNAIDIAKFLPSTMDLRGTLTSQLRSTKRSNNASNEQPIKKLKTEDGFVIPLPPKSTTLTEEEPKINDDISDDILDFNDSEPRSISLVDSHLKLLANSKVSFLNESKPGVYYIPYSDLMPILRSSIYDYIIASTLGPSAMRVRRCILENKLVSEKVINSTALMKEKDIRSTIASLIRYNVVEIQEVPRTADRVASRAVFLFRSKERHSYDFMKQNLAWNIANLLFKNDRLKVENQTLLTKANRDDVKGRENELLLPSEINQLKMVNERELNVLTRTTRLLSLWEVFKF